MQLKLGNQGLNALMLALTKAVQEETDIVPTLMGWDWAIFDEDGTRIRTSVEDAKFELVVLNPPVVQVLGFDEDEFEDVALGEV